MKAAPSTLDPRTQPWLFALAVTTLAPHAGHLPHWLSGVAAALVAWRLWAWQRGAPLPGRWPLLAMVVGGTAGILLEYRTIFGQEAGVALLALFMALKLMELRARRDATVLVMLGYFLLLTHYFYAESIAVGAWMLFALVIITAALIALQPGVAAAAPARTLRLAGLVLAQSLPLALVLFLLFPRISGPLWALPQDTRKAVTGLPEQMSPGAFSDLSRSTAIAFRVLFDGPPPPQPLLYWRGPVMSDYDGRTWRPGRGVLPANTTVAIEARSAPIQYSMTLEAHHQRWLLALDLPVSGPADARVDASLSLLRKEPLRERLRYTAASALDYLANVHERPEMLRRALALPADLNPRTHALARTWQASETRAEFLVAKALALFRSENFVYTLRPPLLGKHAIDDFLFATRRGFCEHYAAAFVVLMRAAGVPARVVTGYQGGETNPVDGYFVVRQSDAHAWAEVWIDQRGWVRVDPTAAIAPSRIERGIAAALPAGEPLPMLFRADLDWLRDLRYRWEAINNGWNQWVLGYNNERQSELLSRLGLPGDWQTLVTALSLTAGVVLLMVAFWILRTGTRADPAQRLWQRFCARMARLGAARMPWEGPRTYAARVAMLKPDLAPAAANAAAAYERLRYDQTSPDDLAALKAALRQLPAAWKPR